MSWDLHYNIKPVCLFVFVFYGSRGSVHKVLAPQILGPKFNPGIHIQVWYMSL